MTASLSSPYLVSLSGGKDSTAVLLHLLEIGIPVNQITAIHAYVGWDHPDTPCYARDIAARLGVRYVEVQAKIPDLDGRATAAAEQVEALLGHDRPSPFVRICLHRGMFPSRRIRWCTSDLKVEPIARFVCDMDEEPINVIGIRAEESAARAAQPERDRSDKLDCEVWRPILRWTLADVVAIHARHGIKPNPLYTSGGASRVGCLPCIFSRKSELRSALSDESTIQAIRVLEEAVAVSAATRGHPVVPRMFQANRPNQHGKYPLLPIDDVKEWALTSKGGRQMAMFPEEEMFFDARQQGCGVWGFCDIGGDR